MNDWCRLSSECSLACYTYCDRGICLCHSHLFSNVWRWNCHCLFYRLRSVVARISTHNQLYVPSRPFHSTCTRRISTFFFIWTRVLKHNKYVGFKQFSKVDIKQNNISTVIFLLIKFLVYQWDPRHLQEVAFTYLFTCT